MDPRLVARLGTERDVVDQRVGVGLQPPRLIGGAGLGERGSDSGMTATFGPARGRHGGS